MKIQNISGVTQLFSLGRRSAQLTPNETITVDEDEKTVAAVMRHANNGALKVVEGPATASFSRTAEPKEVFGISFGALTRWANNDSVNIGGVKFEADNDATRTVAGSFLVDVTAELSSTITAFENKFITAMSTGAGKTALAAIGVTYKERVTLATAPTLVFELNTAITPYATLVAALAFTNAGGSGTAPSTTRPGVVDGGSAATAVIDLTVQASQTVAIVRLPYKQLLGTPQVTVRDPAGVVQTYDASTNMSVSGLNIRLAGLTATHVVTIVAPVR